jgi:crossover junction endodeoxyribonuclease RuvC
MLIFGIDPGTATTGYALLEVRDGKANLLEASSFATPPELDLPKRLLILNEQLNAKLTQVKPECIVVEKIFFNTNIKTAIAVGQARGVSLLLAAMHEIPVYEYTALQAKLIVTGYGRSKKREVQEAVKNYFNLEKVIKPDDASDAVAISLCHIHKTILGKIEDDKHK